MRDAYPVLERYAYLNAGSTGPLARATVEAIERGRHRDLTEGRGGPRYIEEMLAARERVRAALAAEIAVPPEKLALTSSTTAGCNIVLAGLGLGPGDEVVTTDSEHFGLIGALHVSGARVVVAPPEPERLLAAVTPRTRLIAVSHVLWTTGRVLPVRELKDQSGLPLLVDGAQSVGAIPVDAAGCDWYTVSAQKWLCGPDPSGALYVAEPEALRVALPTYFAQAGYEPDGAFEPKVGAARFDSGWIDPPSLAGLEAALGIHPPWRFERAAELAARCRELLAVRYEVVTEPGQATLVAFRWPDGDPAEAARRAYDRGVVIRDLPTTGLLRASCGYWNSEEDLERLLDALR
ncbi:MAG: aminotransferase class V-fold PLP-dependent enzyme [Thermoleophilia bacterium]|nr:aminotransferase class V-fold PLP-dependent enzyme [Thermoleophilia bacterium]